jgi:hypothetical protein
MSGCGDISLSASNSVSDGGFPFVVFGFFNVEIELFDFNFEVNIVHEVLESLE